MENTILSILTMVALVAYITYQQFILPRMSTADIQTATDIVTTLQQFNLIFQMANKFVIQAKKVFADGQGEEKRNYVISQLKVLADKIGLVLSDEELLAINEDAYNEMKKSESV